MKISSSTAVKGRRKKKVGLISPSKLIIITISAGARCGTNGLKRHRKVCAWTAELFDMQMTRYEIALINFGLFWCYAALLPSRCFRRSDETVFRIRRTHVCGCSHTVVHFRRRRQDAFRVCGRCFYLNRNTVVKKNNSLTCLKRAPILVSWGYSEDFLRKKNSEIHSLRVTVLG